MLLLPRERRTAGRSSAAIVLGFALLWPLSACEQAKVGRPEPASGPAKPPAPERQPPPDATAEAPEAGFVLPDGPIDGFHIDVPAACTNLQCQQTRCPGAPTSLSGTIYAPNGKLPLYNVIAYIPNAPLDPLPSGASCDRCGGKTSGHPIASAISNEEGKFRIENVPSGKDVPLVLQVGKWRRRVIIPEIVACQDNALTDPNLTRLPRNRTEGDLPKIAVTTGVCDTLGCLLPKLGVDATELGVAGQDKAVTFYNGNLARPPMAGVGADPFAPPNPTAAATLWREETELSKYDLVLLSCQCSEQLEDKGPAAYQAMTNYLSKGGRIFGTDFMYVWYRYSPDPQLKGALSIVGGAPGARTPLAIDTSFPKGKALADWMKFVDPALTYGEIGGDNKPAFANFTSAMPATSQVWATSNEVRKAIAGPRIVTINTPAGLPADQQCGRAVHLDAHIGTVALGVLPFPTKPGAPGASQFPASCGTQLSKSETALAFLFFDLAACIQNDAVPVAPPPVNPD